MYKNNSRNNSIFKSRSPLQLHPKLKVDYFTIGYHYYTHRCIPLGETVGNTHLNIKNLIFVDLKMK